MKPLVASMGARMTGMIQRSIRLFFILASLLIASPSIAEIPRTEAPRYAAPKGKALLVLARDKKWVKDDQAHIVMDERGRCLGILEDTRKATAPLDPGTHMLVLISGVVQPSVELLRVRAEEGKTYVLKLDSGFEPVSGIVRRERDQQDAFPWQLLQWVPHRRTSAYAISPWADIDECSQWALRKRKKLQRKAVRAMNEWDAADKEFREARTIRAHDGWTATEIYGP